MVQPKLILASSSPRRRELLSLTGIPFLAEAADVDETCTLQADQAVVELSRRKAQAVFERRPGYTILGSDTLVSIHGQGLGKPADTDDAFRMIAALRGNWHDVFTGVTVISPEGHADSRLSASRVHFSADFTDDEIRRYVATGEPMDKAGAYALQGLASLWIDRIEGSYSGIIGLPMETVRELLAACGFTFPFVK